MPDDRDQRVAREFYASLDYQVEPIEVANEGGRRADYPLIGFGDTVVMECKTRVADEAFRHALETAGTALRRELLALSNSISTQVKDATDPGLR